MDEIIRKKFSGIENYFCCFCKSKAEYDCDSQSCVYSQATFCERYAVTHRLLECPTKEKSIFQKEVFK